jgi:hypothetical protein
MKKGDKFTIGKDKTVYTVTKTIKGKVKAPWGITRGKTTHA